MPTDPRIERTRQTVIETVLSILFEEGWEAITHLRVAQKSGIGRNTLYRHWPDRVDLLRAALVDRSITQNISATGDLRADLIAELQAMVRELVDNRLGLLLAALIERSEWDAALNRTKAVLIANAMASLRELLQDGRVSGQLRVDTDIERGVAELVGPITFRRFISNEVLSEPFVVGVVDDFLSAHPVAQP